MHIRKIPTLSTPKKQSRNLKVLRRRHSIFNYFLCPLSYVTFLKTNEIRVTIGSNRISCVSPRQYHDYAVRTLQFHPTRFWNLTLQRTPPSRLTLVSVGGGGSSLLCVLTRHRFVAYLSPF